MSGVSEKFVEVTPSRASESALLPSGTKLTFVVDL